jgi:hypothetical protein
MEITMYFNRPQTLSDYDTNFINLMYHIFGSINGFTTIEEVCNYLKSQESASVQMRKLTLQLAFHSKKVFSTDPTISSNLPIAWFLIAAAADEAAHIAGNSTDDSWAVAESSVDWILENEFGNEFGARVIKSGLCQVRELTEFAGVFTQQFFSTQVEIDFLSSPFNGKIRDDELMDNPGNRLGLYLLLVHPGYMAGYSSQTGHEHLAGIASFEYKYSEADLSRLLED